MHEVIFNTIFFFEFVVFLLYDEMGENGLINAVSLESRKK